MMFDNDDELVELGFPKLAFDMMYISNKLLKQVRASKIVKLCSVVTNIRMQLMPNK